MQNFWNFKAIPDTEIILTSIQSKLILKEIQVIPMERFSEVMKTFFVMIFGEKYEVTFGRSQKV